MEERDDGVTIAVRAVLDALPDAVVVTDQVDTVLFWNPAAERLFGIGASEVVGRPLPTIPGPEEHGLREGWMREVEAGRPVETTARRRRGDGTEVDVSIRYTSLHPGVPGAPVVGVCRPLVDSQASDEQRLQSQVRLTLVRHLSEITGLIGQGADVDRVLRSVLEAAVAIGEADSGAVSVRAGDGYRRVATVGMEADLSAEVMAGQGLHGQVVETGQEVVVDDYRKWEHALPGLGDLRATVAVPIVAGAEVAGAISVHHRSTGARFAQPELEALRLLADCTSAALATTSSYQQVLLEQLRVSAVLDAVPDGLVVVEDGLVSEWNQCAARLTGWTRTEVMGRPLPAELRAPVADREGLDGATHRLEPIVARLDGDQVEVILLRDVTYQFELEKAKDLFFAATSHELKTPLTVIKGFAATLRNRWEEISPENRDEALATVHRRAEHLEQLIERILVGSRIGASGYEVRLGPIEPAPVVGDMVTAFAAVSDGHDVRAEVADGLPAVAADRHALDTILGHLLENAVKYSPDGGCITVRVSDAGGRVLFEVLDEGVGLPDDADRVEDLFRPFAQADGGDDRRFGGVGLGLYIVRRLVTAQHGEMEAARRPEGGSRFAFTVPAWSSEVTPLPGI